MYQCVSELPQANRDTLAAVILHLQKVSQSPETQMGISNLAKVFGPTLVGHRSSNPTHIEMLEDIKSQPIVCTMLFIMPKLTLHYLKWINFGKNCKFIRM